MELAINRKKSSQNYKKPRLRTIELAAEEVLAAGCKTAGTTNVSGNQFSCILPNTCSADGS